MTFEQLVDHVRGKVREQLGLFTLPPSLSRDVVEAFVKATIGGLGFHVNDAGDVCDPRPRPVTTFPNNQNGVRYSGQQRRRGYRR
jgi:hypothetical protein